MFCGGVSGLVWAFADCCREIVRRIRSPANTGDTFRSGVIVFMGVRSLAGCFMGRGGAGRQQGDYEFRGGYSHVQIEMQWQNWNDCAADERPADSEILRIPVIFSAENRSV